MVNLLEAECGGGVKCVGRFEMGPMSSAYIRHLLAANLVSPLAIDFIVLALIGFCNLLFN